MRVFLSWSGEHSRAVAGFLREWLPRVVPHVDPWMSDSDIATGDRWSRSVDTAVATAEYAVIILTPVNLISSWVLFEAGALARALRSEAIAPYLVGVEYSQLPSPLAQFQAARADRLGTRKLVEALNSRFARRSTAALRHRFELEWPALELYLTQLSRRVLARSKRVDGLYVSNSREGAYGRAIDVIRRVAREQKGTKSLLLTALHGHQRLSAGTEVSRNLRAFDSLINECARSTGADAWNVRQLYNITTTKRLKYVLQIIQTAAEADGFEVRAICVPNAMPPLAPLVIGRRDLLIGFDDPRYYRVGGAIHIQNDDAVALATRHFDGLWQHPACVAIRSAIGLEKSGVEEIRTRLRQLA